MLELLLGTLLSAAAGLVPPALEAPVLPRVEWKALLQRPDRLRGRTVRLLVQHHSLVTQWEPYLTPLTPWEHVQVVGWADEQLPWVESDYDAPAVRLFVPRGSRAARTFAAAKPHERFVVACELRCWLQGRPWIEVLSARRTREYVPEGTVLHAAQAEDFLEREAWPLALDQLDRALAAPLPAHARVRLEAAVAEVARLEAEAGVRGHRLRRRFTHDRPTVGPDGQPWK